MIDARWRLLGAGLAVSLALWGCSKGDAPAASAGAAAPAAARQAISVEAVAAQAKGFTVGALMSANPVYVFFDPQCPHCGHLWQSSVALHKQVKFVWVPIAFNHRSPSVEQGAALLTAANPVQQMNDHEALLLANKGGMSASSDVPAELSNAIKTNTGMLNTFAIEAVPFLVAKNQKTGELVTHSGAMETAELATVLGVGASAP